MFVGCFVVLGWFLRLFAFVDLPFMVFVVLCGLHTSGDCFGV